MRGTKTKDETTPYWKDLVEHIDLTWRKKKGVPFFFQAKYFKTLKELSRIYLPYGVMALWDLFLDESDPYVKQTGHSFEMFLHRLPRLLDDSTWKVRRESYEKKLIGLYPPIVELFGKELLDQKKGRTLHAASYKDDPGPALLLGEDKGQTSKPHPIVSA